MLVIFVTITKFAPLANLVMSLIKATVVTQDALHVVSRSAGHASPVFYSVKTNARPVPVTAEVVRTGFAHLLLHVPTIAEPVKMEYV
jgi:hypothetical protein